MATCDSAKAELDTGVLSQGNRQLGLAGRAIPVAQAIQRLREASLEHEPALQ